jgi:hypothetical protein
MTNKNKQDFKFLAGRWKTVDDTIKRATVQAKCMKKVKGET